MKELEFIVKDRKTEVLKGDFHLHLTVNVVNGMSIGSKEVLRFEKKFNCVLFKISERFENEWEQWHTLYFKYRNEEEIAFLKTKSKYYVEQGRND